ncbi:MAG TPA: DUF748 domain-containing protein [Myxococcota bacterium]|nr:DUF748 domain-containing protein [Myxococcota bacterium]
MKLPDRAAIGAVLRVRRNQLLLALLVLLVAARIALPYVLRPIIVKQADEALIGRIALRDLDLSLLRGGVTLHGLEVYADELPAGSSGDVKPPLFATERLWVNISWLELLWKTLDVEEFQLDDFTVRLDRLKDGLALPKPVPSPEPAKPPEQEEPSSWALAAGSVVLHKGSVVFRDFTVGDNGPQRFDLAIPNLEARKLALRFDPNGKEPGHVEVEADVGGGRIGFKADMEQKQAGPSTHSNIVIADLPIAGVRVYLKMFGWSDLAGTLDASIDHRFETGGAHTVSGTLGLSNVVVSVPKLDHPALSFRKLTVGLDEVDVVKQHAAVADVRLEGAHVVVDPRSKRPLLVLEPPAKPPEPEQAAAPAAEAAPAKPWTWLLKRARLEGAEVELLGADSPLTLGVDAEVKNVADPTTGSSPVSLAVKEGAGSLQVGGDLTLKPLSFKGKLGLTDFALAPLAARAPAPGAELLRDGKARADLELILAGRGASAPNTSDLRVAGSFGLADLAVGKPGDKDFAVGWKDLAVQLKEATVLPALGGDPAVPRAIAVTLQRVTVSEPTAALVRTADGLVLPKLAAPAPGEAPADSQPPSAPAAPAPAPEVKARLDSFRLQRGKVHVLDRSVTPFYEARIEQLDANAVKILWPPPAVDAFVADLKGLHGALLHVHGGIQGQRTRVRAELTTMPLAPLNPYVSPSGYALSGGDLSLELTAHLEGGTYDSQTDVAIQSLEVGGAQGEALFEENFGIPLSMAIGLLKNQEGVITLSVPVAGDRAGTHVGLSSLAGQALRKALVGALASPLKLLGAGTKDGKIDLRPAPVEFQPGGIEPTESGASRIEQLATLLTSSPALSLTLHGGTSTGDLRALRERALLAELERSTGLRALGNLGEMGTRRAVRLHLEASTTGQSPPPLDDEQSKWLEAKLSSQSLPDGALSALAAQRADALHAKFVSEKGIEAERVTVGSPAPERSLPVPGVAIDVGARPSASH